MKTRTSMLKTKTALLLTAVTLIMSCGHNDDAARSPTITRISVATDGAEGYGESAAPSISADGRYVAFVSRATNLVPGDMNGTEDIFVHDRETGSTSRVSIATDRTEPNGSSRNPAISGDGRYVAFASYATNLVPGLTACGLFFHDRETGNTTCISVATDGVGAGGDRPAISFDGRYVAFDSNGPNLVTGDTNGIYTTDIFVHDSKTGETTRVSVATDGTEANGSSYGASISADGRYVAFESYATNFVPGDTNGTADIFVHDRETGQTARVSVVTGGAEAIGTCTNPVLGSNWAAISADGRYVAFVSCATNLVAGDANNDMDVFVHDRETGETRHIPLPSEGEWAQARAWAGSPSISGDGRYVAFQSGIPDLGIGDLFIRDRSNGTTARVLAAVGVAESNGASSNPQISADGRSIAFESYATDLVKDDTNDKRDVFVIAPIN